MLLNLTSNAVKYNHHAGSIRIACSPTGGGRVGIVVRDTGPGIPAVKMEPRFLDVIDGILVAAHPS